jgi:hypothetical protein
MVFLDALITPHKPLSLALNCSDSLTSFTYYHKRTLSPPPREYPIIHNRPGLSAWYTLGDMTKIPVPPKGGVLALALNNNLETGFKIYLT